MSDPTRPNAIERRLAHLEERWDAFARDPDARLLRWSAPDDDLPLVDAFFTVQCEGRGEVADCFVRLDAPFADPATHGAVLTAALAAYHADARDALAAAGHPAAWSPPAPRPDGDDASAFARACASFQAAHAGLGLLLAVVLAPGAIADDAAWNAWLGRLVRAEPAAPVRFVVAEVAEAPRLDALAAAEPVRVRTDRLALDMAGARLALARAADRGDAASAFRLEYLALTAAAGRSELQAARGHADRALAVATREGWPAMQVAVHLALGSAFLGAGLADDALAACRAAGASARAAAGAGDPAANALIVQSGLSEGAALVSAGRWGDAAAAYAAAAPVATDAADHMLALEGWRMAAWCHARTGDLAAAWRCGWSALDAGERLDPGWRAASTLPVAGRALVDVARRQQWAAGVHAAEQRLAALLAPPVPAPPAGAAGTPAAAALGARPVAP
jgi:hypothetical protein